MLRTLGRHLARSAFVRPPPPSARRADAPQALAQQAPPPPPAAFAAGRRWAGAASGELALATPPSTASLLPPAPPAELDAGAALTPQKVVELLDRYIVGQADAKRAVAVALRNRWRRHKVGSPLKEEIVPKNILMIGPTGCGKTEIARRLAKLTDAPFIKVEATKFTEVGFHGRDVDTIIRDLVEAAIPLTRTKLRAAHAPAVASAVEERILDIMMGTDGEKRGRDTFRDLLRSGDLDSNEITVELPASRPQRPVNVLMGESGPGLNEIMGSIEKAFGGRRNVEQKRLKISEARPLLEEVEFERLVSAEGVLRDAIAAVEQDGIVFIDEIDKIVSSSDARSGGADASAEGVQRDLLPIIEGCSVSTKHGPVNTDHILFICSGAFHSCKPSDMLAELQGRLPIRVELKGLSRDDMYRILTQPEHSLLKQQQALMATEGVGLTFEEEAIREVAAVAHEVNRTVDNIGARRLHTIIERILEDVSFNAPERAAAHRAAAAAGGEETLRVAVGLADVKKAVGPLLVKSDLSKFVL